MAFFDKLGDIAKSIGDLTNEALETTKLNSKINTEKSYIDDLMKRIGEFYYAKHTDGEELPTEILEYCSTIDEHNKVIADSQLEIERIKAQKEAQRVAESEAEKEAQLSSEGGFDENSKVCPNCNASVADGVKFCHECGTKIFDNATSVKFCTSCGATLKNGVKFCMECGTKI